MGHQTGRNWLRFVSDRPMHCHRTANENSFSADDVRQRTIL